MDPLLQGSLVQIVVVVASWEGWRALRVWLEGRKARHTPPHGTPAPNGFSRDDHAQLAIIAERLARLDKVEVSLGRIDNDIGRIVMLMGWDKIWKENP